MSTNHLYFKVSGGAVLEAIRNFNALRAEQNKAILDLIKDFGADEAYCTDEGVVALKYEAAPERVPAGWVLVGNKHYAPTRRTKEGKAVRARFDTCKMSGWWTFHQRFMGLDLMLFMRDMVFSSMAFEKVGGTYVLRVPDIGMQDLNATELDLQGSSGPTWTPPDEHTTRLKTSDYWLLKEAATQAAGRKEGPA